MPGAAPLLIALIGAAWLAAAIAATLLGVRRARAAGRAIDDARAMAGLIAASPSVPMLIHADGRIEAEARLRDWFGLAASPRRLAELREGAAAADDIDRLEHAIAAAFATGDALAETLTLAESGHVLSIEGGPYSAAGLADRAMLLWFTDATAREREIGRLRGETDRLGRSLHSLSALIEAAPFPMWHRDPDLRLALVNLAYVRAVEGRDATDVVRRGLELIEAGGEGGPAAMAARARDRATVGSRVAPAIVEGQRRMMRVIDVPIPAIGVAGFAADVQELEDARADLARFEAAQRDMLDRLSAGVAQFAADHSLVFYNSHFVRSFALEPEWLADRPAFDRVLERMRETGNAPESRDFPRWRAERRGWFLAADPIEETWLLPGGVHLRVVAQPLPDGGMLLIFEDLTEHLQLASARDTLLRVRTATFDNLFEAVGVFAADGRLHLWNNRFREVWDLEEEELVRHPRVDALVQAIAPKLIDPGRASMIRELVRVATVERQQRSGRIALKDGRHFEFAAVPLPDGNALFTLLDITASRGIEEALRDRNEALEQANSLKSAFVARMSYELRVPLTSIAGFAEMLAGGYAGALDATARDYVEAILSAVSGLSSLIGDVLDLSQSEVGALPLAADPIELSTLVREAAGSAAAGASANRLTVALDLHDCGEIDGDRRRLRQCLDHLLRNAIAHTPPGGRILLRTRMTGDWAEIVISDNGSGIAPELRARLIDRQIAPGSAGESAEAGAQAGGAPEVERRARVGVGLPLARQLIEAHGGALELASELGRGTSVTIRLPLREPAHAG